MILTRVKNEVGATAIEYAVLSSLIAVATITGLQLTGVKLEKTYCTVASALGQVVGAGGGGCSSSSSNASSGSSNNSSSTDSGNSSTDSSADASSSAVSSSSEPIIYNASNSYSGDASRAWSALQLGMSELSYAHGGLASMTGIYDAEGNAITTPEDIKNYFGISDQAYEYAMGELKYTPALEEASLLEADNLSKSGKRYYIPDPKKVTITATDGSTYKFYQERAQDSGAPGEIDELYKGPGSQDYYRPSWYSPTK